MNYLLHLIVYFDIYLIVALSLNLVVGYAGLLTLAHAGYYAVGAYAYALLSVNLDWGFVPAVAVGILVSAALSLAVSLCSWRLKGDFFVLASLAVQALIFSALYNWHSVDAPLGSLRNLTNGPFGIVGIHRPSLFGYSIVSPIAMAAFASVVAALCALVVWRLSDSSWGRVLVAMREDELAARGLGKNTRLLKVQVFAISSGLVAIAGALYASHVRYLDPTSATLDESILMLSMVVVGGVGNFRGPFVGAAILVGLPELLRFLSLPDAQAANLRMLIYGLMLILMMHFRPQGVAGEYRVE
ncbi:branched-chain amino acid ABC transporter permease [Aporhodopirellula aestuarii]|uniref:Branched-chain amino acid ABC transporter permease n=1 Tax=Aporhodopirellula aestuarii TaxID=2950107 RepID=A0ABT0UCA8_9BACT|nr:branched-chain amino acid ABC transporter permease [Aporhodopirellula aestuarii]MCM2374653.1 branched-chain amino acid ABC transporter permease [Aporhodopirellula aestuarii]